jgi:CRISPR-associated protein Csx10
MSALVYQLELLSPVLVSRPGAGEEDSDQSYPFITGSAIRGALATRYLSNSAEDEDFYRRFLSGQVRFLNAYPVYPTKKDEEEEENEGQRLLPAPLSWRVKKSDRDREDDIDALDFATASAEEIKQMENPKNLGESFTTIEQDVHAIVARSVLQVAVHNVSHKRHVKGKEDSSLFQYEALAPGYLYEGVIVGNEDDLEVMQKLLAQQGASLWLGGSRNAGYGHTRVTMNQIKSEWQETGASTNQDGEVVITLLSDVIVRDANGGYSTQPADLLGVKPKRTFMRTRVVGGFNRKWGLPLVQAPAFQAGSVFVYDAADVKSDQLQYWLENGIGERRAEGFGRIAVNWLPPSDFKLDKVDLDPVEPESVSLSKESKALAQLMAQRHFKTLLDQRLSEQVSNLNITRKPSNAQMNKLRNVLRKVMRNKSWEPLVKRKGDGDKAEGFLSSLNTDAKKQFTRARIDGEKFIDWLKRAENDGLWNDYFASESPPVIAGEQAQIDESIKIDYVVRLIDALLQKASKEKGG